MSMIQIWWYGMVVPYTSGVSASLFFHSHFIFLITQLKSFNFLIEIFFALFLFQLRKENVFMRDIDYVEEVIDSLIVGGADQLQVIISKSMKIWYITSPWNETKRIQNHSP